MAAHKYGFRIEDPYFFSDFYDAFCFVMKAKRRLNIAFHL
jgi:hypothetical protein